MKNKYIIALVIAVALPTLLGILFNHVNPWLVAIVALISITIMAITINNHVNNKTKQK